MKLKEQIKIFDESFKDSSGEPTKVPAVVSRKAPQPICVNSTIINSSRVMV